MIVQYHVRGDNCETVTLVRMGVGRGSKQAADFECGTCGHRIGALILLGIQRAIGRGKRSIRVDSALRATRYDTAAMARVLPLLLSGEPRAPQS
jgi:hypothetical protein